MHGGCAARPRLQGLVKVILGLAEAYRVLRVPTRAGLVQGMPGDARDTLDAEDWRQVTQQFESGSYMYNK